MYPDKPKNSRKHDRSRRNTRFILVGCLLVGFLLVLFIYWSSVSFTPKIDLSGVTTVEIHDPLWDYSFDIPPITTYLLEMEDGALVGRRTYTASPLVSKAELTDVTIPPDDVTQFLKTLEEVELVKVELYAGVMDSEPYPMFQMIFHTDHGEIMFYAMLQASDQVKWSARIDGQYYVINSTIPADALNHIYSYLDPDAETNRFDMNTSGK